MRLTVTCSLTSLRIIKGKPRVDSSFCPLKTKKGEERRYPFLPPGSFKPQLTSSAEQRTLWFFPRRLSPTLHDSCHDRRRKSHAPVRDKSPSETVLSWPSVQL